MTRLLVVGDTVLDRDIVGVAHRLSPDAPVPVVDVDEIRERPGGAGLAAMAAARRAGVVLATALGDDAAGQRVRRLLADDVVVRTLARLPGTPAKVRVRVDGQSLVRLDDVGHLLDGDAATVTVPPSDVAAEFELLAAAADVIVASDYGGGLLRRRDLRSALRREASRRVLVWDPHARGAVPPPGTTLVTPNVAEAVALLGEGELPAHELAPRLRARWRVGVVAVTDGPRGVVLADGHGVLRVQGPACPEGTDTCGAGDHFAVGMALALASGQAPREAVARVVHEVSAWLGGARRAEESAAGDEPAEDVVARVRAAGGTVVATGGCFDVLHAGHLALFRTARSLGDCLVVLMNSDASVHRLKGAGRPVNDVAFRARMVGALRDVDAVAVFEDDTPIATLERFRPDVWVKGADYDIDDLPERRAVQSWGGRVELVPVVAGHSTTGLLQDIARSVRPSAP